jgi:hypothetical protein
MERIKMVRGLQGNDVSSRRKEEVKKTQPVVEEPNSTMTHAEIEEFSTKFNISWQQVFQLDAEFWALITIE